MTREGDATRDVVDPGMTLRAGTVVLPVPAATATERRRRMKHIAGSSSATGDQCLVCVDMASWGRWSDR